METLRVTALVLRPINDKGNISNEDIQKITEEDLQGVERYWIQYVQQKEFGAELAALVRDKNVPKQSKIITLKHYMSDGIIRINRHLIVNLGN